MAAFTLIELIVIILLISILAAVAVPRLADRSSSDAFGFHGQVTATLQYARKIAVASRRYVCVTIDGASVSLNTDPRVPEDVGGAPNCNSPLAFPGAGGGACAGNQVCTPSGVTLTASVASFSFSPLGRSSSGVTVAVSGQADITVEAETGYVY